MPKTTNNTENKHALQCVGECLYRSQKSKRYYAIIKRGGRQIKRSLKTTDYALAKRMLAEFQKQAAGLSHGADGKMSFTALAMRWHTITSASLKPSSQLRQKGVAKKLAEHFGNIPARNVTKHMTEDWAEARSKQVTPRTLNYERECLIRIFDYAIRDGIMFDNPARSITRRKTSTPKAVIPTKEQFKTLLDTIKTLRADALPSVDLCELLAYSGCRLNEATSLTWGDIDFEQKTFTITGGEKGTKNHEHRTVPLFPALESFLNRLLERYPEPPPPASPIVSIRNAKTAMISACRIAELPHFTHHHLRHFFCSNAIEAGIDFKAIAGWLGHRDGGLLVAKTYGHLRDEHSAIMAQRMTFGVDNV
jgi:integrase